MNSYHSSFFSGLRNMSEGFLLYMRINHTVLTFGVLLSVLMLADIITTHYALSLGHREGNRFMGFVVRNVYLFSAVKIVGTVVIIIIYAKIYKYYAKIAKVGMFIILGLMSFVVANNVIVII